MPATIKEVVEFLRKEGADVPHTQKSYLGHASNVHRDLKAWGHSDELALAGAVHSIYGTELFRGFTLPLDRRADVQALVGERAEWIAYLNCAIDRAYFDAQARKTSGPYTILDRFTGETVDVSDEDFQDLCVVHLCDWVEQVPRSDMPDYRQAAYRVLADRVGGTGLAAYERTLVKEPTVA
jgi:hypothetical protein